MLAVRNIGGESKAAWQDPLDDLASRGLPELGVVVFEDAAWLQTALGLVWLVTLVQRSTEHNHRNQLADAPERPHEKILAEHDAMIYIKTLQEMEGPQVVHPQMAAEMSCSCRRLRRSKRPAVRLLSLARQPVKIGRHHQCH